MTGAMLAKIILNWENKISPPTQHGCTLGADKVYFSEPDYYRFSGIEECPVLLITNGQKADRASLLWRVIAPPVN